MSGPKTSHYTLTLEQRQIILEQRKIKLEYELLLKQQKDVCSIISQTDEFLNKSEYIWNEVDTDTSNIDEVKKIRSNLMTTLNQAEIMNTNSSLNSLQEINKKITILSNKLEKYTKELKSEFYNIEKTFHNKMIEQIEYGFSLSFDNIFNEDSLKDNIYYKKIQEAFLDVSNINISDEQSKRIEIIKEKANEIDSIEFLKNFYSITVLPFVKECKLYNDTYEKYGEEYKYKLYIYQKSAKELGVITENIPFSSEAVSILDEKIKKIEEAIRFKEEQEYISRCIDEAMVEMGYSIIGDREIVKKSGRKFRNELYLFDEGTAVNITYSDNGNITMELGGISNIDRIPTNSECDSLISDMNDFCNDYHKLENYLIKKGIVTEKISILPPEAQFAQIINVSDYNLNTEVTEYEFKKVKKQTLNSKVKKIGE